MAAETTLLSSIVATARGFADAETPSASTDFTPDAQLLERAVSAYKEFVDLVISSGDAAVDLLGPTQETITSPWELPEDAYRVVAVDIPCGARWRPARTFNFSERFQSDSTRYRVSGRTLLWMSEETSMQPTSARVWYIPQQPELDLSDSVATFNGWGDAIAYRVAAFICLKEGRNDDMNVMDGKATEILQRIKAQCAALVLSQTTTIAETEFYPESAIDLRFPVVV